MYIEMKEWKNRRHTHTGRMPTYYDDVIYIEYVWYVYGLLIHIVIWHTTAKNLPLKNLFVTSLMVHINGIVVAYSSLYTSVEQIKFVFLALKRKLFCRLKKNERKKWDKFFCFFLWHYQLMFNWIHFHSIWKSNMLLKFTRWWRMNIARMGCDWVGLDVGLCKCVTVNHSQLYDCQLQINVNFIH